MSEDNKPAYKKNFPFEEEVIGRFKKWTGVKTKDIDEAFVGLTGDTYFEMRKLESQILTAVENLILSGLYTGYVNGKELTADQKKSIKVTREDHKEHLRKLVEEAWRSMLHKQTLGVDKLGLALKAHIKNDEETDIPGGSSK